MQKEAYVPRSILVDPSYVLEMIGIQRSTSGQIYYMHSLEKSLHFTIPSKSFGFFISKAYKASGETPFFHVPNKMNY